MKGQNIMPRISFKRRSVAFNWLVSYLSVLLIPLVISFAIYYRTASVIGREIDNTNSVLLQQIRQIVDSRLQEIGKLSFQIKCDTVLQELASNEGPLDGSDMLVVHQLIAKYAVLQTANGFIDHFLVYLDNQDAFITTGAYYNSGILSSPQIQEAGFNYADLSGQLKLAGDKAVYLYPGPSANLIVCSEKVISSVTFKPVATVAFLISTDKLLDAEGIALTSAGTVFILDKDNMLFATTNPNLAYSDLSYDRFPQQESIERIRTAQGRLAVSQTTSDVLQWKYFAVTPLAVYTQKANAVRNFTSVSLIISALLGALVSYLFTRRNYNPVQALIQKLNHALGRQNEARLNEFSFISNAIDDTVRSKEMTDQLLRKQNRTMQAHLLAKLLRGRLDNTEPVEEMLAAHEIRFRSDRFAVLLLFIEESSLLNPDQDLQLIRFAVQNVFEEILNRDNQCFLVDMEDIMAGLVSLQPDAESLAGLESAAREAMDFLNREIGIAVTVAISQAHQGLTGIQSAHAEAVEIMGYRLLAGSSRILRLDDITGYKQGGGKYTYPLEIEQQLINSIRAGDLANARRLLDQVYEINFASGRLSLTLARCLIFDLISTILKTLDDIKMLGDDYAQSGLKPVERILGCKTVMDMKQEMDIILTRTCADIQKEQKGQGQKTINDIIRYVRENYQDENLSVSRIADCFQMNLSYISKQFKRQAGDGLYDYINKYRIGQAKQLLMEGGGNIGEIARQVGFGNDNSFIRVFKKYEGITPGKFKELHPSGK